jgi:hypothetical protein
MQHPINIEFEDTEVVELPIGLGVSHDEEVTQPMAIIPMAELQATPPEGVRIARSYSRDLEVRPEIALGRAPTIKVPQTIAPPSNGIPVRVWPERARRLTQPFGSRGRGPSLKVG